MIPVSLSAIHTDILPLSFPISPFRPIVAHYSPFRSPLTLFKDPLSRFPVHIVLPLLSLLHPNTPSCPWSCFNFPVSATIPDYVLHLKTGSRSPQWQKTWTFFFLGLGYLIWSSLVPSLYLQSCWFHFLYIWVVLQCVCVLPFQCPFIGRRTSRSFPLLLRIASQWVNTCLWGRISICQGVFIAASVLGSALW